MIVLCDQTEDGIITVITVQKGKDSKEGESFPALTVADVSKE